jgi:hypothetical protein
MPNAESSRGLARAVLSLCGAVTLLFPAGLRGEGLAREALSSFPDDTVQFVYTNLAEVHASPAYPQIRQRLLGPQLRDFMEFLRSMGTDPEKDVDEVVLGWRGADSANFFGLASGRFQPEQARELFTQKQVPSRQYAGFDLYAFGSGQGSSDLFFSFLSSSLAVFGRLTDLTALLDARSGARARLESNSNLAGWEAELAGSAPQWGFMAGRAAANMAIPWLTGAKLPANRDALLGPVQGVLYRVEWSTGFSVRLSIVCQNAESASALAQVLTFLRDSPPATTANPSTSISSLLQGLAVETDGSRVELSGSGPVAAVDQFLRGTLNGPAQ